MTIVPILWTSRKTKSGVYPIKIRVTEMANGKAKIDYHSLDISIPKNDWDTKNKLVKNTNPLMQEINLKIQEMVLKFNKSILNGEQISTGESDSFFWWFDEFLKVCEVKNSKYYYRKMSNVKSLISTFKPNISIKEINLKLIQDFELHLISLGKHPNYIADCLARVKFIIKKIIDSGSMDHHKNPFLKFQIKYIKTEKIRLNIEQIRLFEKSNLAGMRKVARDWYMISFYGGGIRFGDMCRLNEKNYEGGNLKYTMHKTGIQKNIPLPQEAINLLKIYDFKFPVRVTLASENTEILHSNPVINRKLKQDKEDMTIGAANALMNKYLKAALRESELPEVPYHTTRHGITDYAVKMGLSDTQLQNILGHGTSRTTMIYKRSFYQEATDSGYELLFPVAKKKK